MPIEQTSNPDIPKMQGVHLYHASMSSCSQRVRFALVEKAVAWESHLIDLNLMENVSDWYQRIHPRGYVPALVHDGTLVTESTDIIAYIDQTFPGDALEPVGESERSTMQKWVDYAGDNQWCLKTLTYHLIFRAQGHFSKKKDVEYYLSHQKNPQLVQFMKDFVAGFSSERLDDNMCQAYDFLADVNDALSGSEYLAGEVFSLADIASIVNVHRYRMCRLDLGQFPALLRWYALVESRPGFKKAIVDWL
ncbi:MAG: glutathione S-transferase family protein [Porticoccaceae bacterium]|nr:glutathione S-transferase family protein [Porticoccaceae bacterium]